MKLVYIVMKDKYESYPVVVCSTADKAQKYVKSCLKRRPDDYYEIDAWVVDGEEMGFTSLADVES